MKIDMAIPTFLGASRVPALLESLRDCTPRDRLGAVCVSIDQADTPERAVETERQANLLIRVCAERGVLVTRPESWGYMARNWNQAIQGLQDRWGVTEAGAVADWVAVLNDDLVMTPGWLDVPLEILEALGDRLGAIGLSVDSHLEVYPAAGKARLASHPWGPAFLMRRELWERRGGFSEDTQMLEAELGEWTWRANLCSVNAGLLTSLGHQGNAAHKTGIKFGTLQQGGTKSLEAWQRRYGYDYLTWPTIWSERLARLRTQPWPKWVETGA